MRGEKVLEVSAGRIHVSVSVEPERSEVIHGPNLGGFLGLAPDLRRSGQQGLAWLWNAGTGLGIWHFPKSGSGCDPAGNGFLQAYALPSQSRLSLSLHARTSQQRISREQRISGGEFFLRFAWLETPPRVYTMATTVAMPSSRQRDDVFEAFTRLSDSLLPLSVGDNFDRDAAITACQDGIRAFKVILALLLSLIHI